MNGTREFDQVKEGFQQEVAFLKKSDAKKLL